jgi:acetylornithine/N-succinyldiaminopimelate aminotransferase
MTSQDALMQTYAKPDVVFERGEGAWMFASDGKRYLDFTSGIAVTSFGHCHPHLVKALSDQAAKLWHTSNLFRVPGQETFSRRLADASFADRVFFANSGAEAVECGLKLVRKYQDDFGDGKRFRVIACEGSFHGRTLAGLAAAGNAKYLKGYDPVVEGFEQVPFGNLNVLRQRIGPETAAILVEPVQGEGGLRAGSDEYLQGLRRVCDEYGLLLFFDEVQCGMGRTGKLFAHEWAGVKPDIVATAKAIGGGFPLGACLATEKVARAFTLASHGTTFGGNPLAMAVGNAALDILLAEGFLDNVVERGRQLQAGLEGIMSRHMDIFSEHRGKGLIQGLKCRVSNTEMVEALRAKGLLVLTAADDMLRLLPPLIVSQAEIEQALTLIEDVARAKKAA